MGARRVLKKALIKVDRQTYRQLLAPMVAFLPAPIAYGVALLRSDIQFRLSGDQRRQIKYSLELLFGDRYSPQQRDQIARDCIRNVSCQAIDAVRLLGNGGALLGRVEVHGREHLREALARGKGAVLCSAHFGSERSCFSLVGALGFRISIIVRRSIESGPRKDKLGKLLYRLRYDYPLSTHLHHPTIVRNSRNYGVAVQAVRVLKKNEFVGTMIDGEVWPGDPSKPMKFDFLNGKAILVPGATMIAQLTGAPVLVVLLRRSPDWRHLILEISPPIDVKGEPMTAFAQCLALVDSAIKRHPDQWTLYWHELVHLVRLGLVSHDLASHKMWKAVEN